MPISAVKTVDDYVCSFCYKMIMGESLKSECKSFPGLKSEMTIRTELLYTVDTCTVLWIIVRSVQR